MEEVEEEEDDQEEMFEEVQKKVALRSKCRDHFNVGGRPSDLPQVLRSAGGRATIPLG